MTLEEEIKSLEEEKQKQTDEFYSREQVIKTLADVLEQQESQTVYVQPAPGVKPTNYVLYIGLAIAGFILFKGFKK